MRSTKACGNNGAFFVKSIKHKITFKVIASDGEGWEHVSVSLPNRCPTWDEMCFIKDKFWGEKDAVIQFHPPKSESINVHPYCLHLWRSNEGQIHLPETCLVG